MLSVVSFMYSCDMTSLPFGVTVRLVTSASDTAGERFGSVLWFVPTLIGRGTDRHDSEDTRMVGQVVRWKLGVVRSEALAGLGT